MQFTASAVAFTSMQVNRFVPFGDKTSIPSTMIPLHTLGDEQTRLPMSGSYVFDVLPWKSLNRISSIVRLDYARDLAVSSLTAFITIDLPDFASTQWYSSVRSIA